MQWIASQGIALTNSYASMFSLRFHTRIRTDTNAVTHPSQPNYVAAVGGENFGLQNDDDVTIPSFIATVVDLLDTKGISWAEYLEDYQGDVGKSSQGDYVRKHNALASYESVTRNDTRKVHLKSFEDFQDDLSARRLPQWAFFTPNDRNDGHDTGLAFGARWLRGWLEPLLKNEYFFEDTLIVVTFDEASPDDVINHIYTIILGGAVPPSMRGTTTTMYFNHYSALSTVSVNWDLPSLGRWDCAANVFPPVAERVDYTNTDIDYGSMEWDASYPGPLNVDSSTLPGYWPVPDTEAHCAANNGVLPSLIDQWGRSSGTYNYTNVYPYSDGFRQTRGSVPAIGVNDIGDMMTGTAAPSEDGNDAAGRDVNTVCVFLMFFFVVLLQTLFD